MNEGNARKIYQEYIEELNDENQTRELIAYQDYGNSFAIIEITTKREIGGREIGSIKDYQITQIRYNGNVEPIRTYSDLREARITLLALSYIHKPIIELPF